MSQPIEPDRPFARLTPSLVLDAVEGMGLVVDGRLMALNSYENRVYRVGIDPASPVGPGCHDLLPG